MRRVFDAQAVSAAVSETVSETREETPKGFDDATACARRSLEDPRLHVRAALSAL
jgi:hypothetical protein